MTRYAHQQVFSTGDWWDLEEVTPGIYRRVYVADEDYLYRGVPVPMPTEQEVVIAVFSAMLRRVTADGGRKRAAGLKPPWWTDLSHRAAIFSHLNKYEHGERIDHDSGMHPFVHLAFRALAIAYQETYGTNDPHLYTANDGTCVGRLTELGKLPAPDRARFIADGSGNVKDLQR